MLHCRVLTASLKYVRIRGLEHVISLSGVTFVLLCYDLNM
jgi:hypothetical protein